MYTAVEQFLHGAKSACVSVYDSNMVMSLLRSSGIVVHGGEIYKENGRTMQVLYV